MSSEIKSKVEAEYSQDERTVDAANDQAGMMSSLACGRLISNTE